MNNGVFFIFALWALPFVAYAMQKIGFLSKRFTDAVVGIVVFVSSLLFIAFAASLFMEDGVTFQPPSRIMGRSSDLIYWESLNSDVAFSLIAWFIFCGALACVGLSMTIAAIRKQGPGGQLARNAPKKRLPTLGRRFLSSVEIPDWLAVCVVALLIFALIHALMA